MKLAAISPTSHAGKRWHRVKSYDFARSETIAPIVLAEIPRAVHAFPVGFVKSDGRYFPVAILGLPGGRNLYVGPDGKWIGGYIPATFRGYPFSIGQTQDGNRLVCIDEESGLLTDDPDGVPLFDDNGELSEETRKIVDFLRQTDENRRMTDTICAQLVEHDLLTPWAMTIPLRTGARTLEGLYRVDEAALNAMPDEAFATLRKSQALPFIYGHLLSTHHMSFLGKLADAHAQQAAMVAKETPKVPDLTGSLSDSDSIDWKQFGM